MSTYYYLVCDKHKESTDAASRSAGGAGPLGDSVSTLPAFIIAHHKCPVRIVDEHLKHDWMEPRTGREWEEVYTEWTQENRKSLIDAADRDGRWL